MKAIDCLCFRRLEVGDAKGITHLQPMGANGNSAEFGNSTCGRVAMSFRDPIPKTSYSDSYTSTTSCWISFLVWEADAARLNVGEEKRGLCGPLPSWRLANGNLAGLPNPAGSLRTQLHVFGALPRKLKRAQRARRAFPQTSRSFALGS